MKQHFLDLISTLDVPEGRGIVCSNLGKVVVPEVMPFSRAEHYVNPHKVEVMNVANRALILNESCYVAYGIFQKCMGEVICIHYIEFQYEAL